MAHYGADKGPANRLPPEAIHTRWLRR